MNPQLSLCAFGFAQHLPPRLTFELDLPFVRCEPPSGSAGTPARVCPTAADLPLSSPQNQPVIRLHARRTISPTQSRTLQSRLQRSIVSDAPAQRRRAPTTPKKKQKTPTTTTTKQVDAGTFPADRLFKKLFSLPHHKHKTFSSLPFYALMVPVCSNICVSALIWL